MKKVKRFVKIYSQDMGTTMILVDTKTGVNYLWHSEGYGGGMVPLLDRDGKVVVSHLPLEEEDLH